MRLPVALLTGLLTSSLVHAQTDWSSEMKNHDRSFVELLSAHDSVWPERPTLPGQGYKPFERFRWLYEHRLDEQGRLPQGSDIIRQWNELRSYGSGRSPAGNWHPLGPILDDVTTRDHIEGVGRVSCVVFHPTDPSIAYLGTPAGGFWRSSDGGVNWMSTTDWLPTLGVSAILIDPANPDIIYIGTGDRDAYDSPGMGVMKSTDGGFAWEFVNAGIDDLTVGALKMIPGTGALVAGTNEGIYRSTDGGLSWEQTSSSTYDFKDLEIHPTDPNILYAAGNGRFHRSTDAGLSWEVITEGISSGTRMVIAVTPADPDRVYVARSNTYSFTGFFMSTDAGVSFTEMSDSPNILGWAADGSSTGGQAWYDFCIEADHENPDVVYVGGIRVKKSIDAGITWIDINPNYVHVDQHEFIISPHNQDLYVSNDGGLYHYVENEEWLDISNGIVNGQIYKLGQSPHDGNHTLTGFQDNGTAEYNGAIWQRRGGGDGFECIYDHTDQSWRYGSIYYGDLYRTSPDFINQKIAGDGELGINESGAWSTPYVLHPSNENIMFVGLKNVWRSVNIKDPERDSVEWVKISNNLMGSNTADMIALEVSMADHSILYGSEGQRKFAKTMNSLAEEVEWINLSSYLPSSLQPVVAIESHPTDTNRVYISFNRNVWQSDDGGYSWTSLTETLPDISINTIVLDTSSVHEGLYIGTDLGIYYRDTTMTDWISFNTGFPYASRVTELEIYYGPTIAESRLKAATYGRGLWESDLFDASTYTFPATALISMPDGTNEVFGPFETSLLFYRNLDEVAMTGVTTDDIWVENGIVTAVNGGPEFFTVQVTPTSYGQIKLFVNSNVAFDEVNIGNAHSDSLFLAYIPAPDPFGPFGPGGVGSEEDIAFWVRADRSVTSIGGIPANAGSPVQQWTDIIGNAYSGVQTNQSKQPTLVDGPEGISGRPALYFDGDDDYLQFDDVVPGKSISAYIMVEGDSIEFNDHGWMASARVSNGYLLHPWKNESRFSAEVLDLDEDYSGSPVYYIGDAAAPHIYGFIYGQDEIHQVFFTVFDDNLHPFPGVHLGERDDVTPIDIRMGWDYEDRYGKGKIAEHTLFSRRLFMSHHRLVSNYYAAKYAIELGPLSLYHHPQQPLDVFGIGRESQYDQHTDAQGQGIIRIQNASSLGDGDYLLIGDDGGSLDFTTDLYPILSSRTERTWGVTETGDAGEVTVRIQTEGLESTDGLGLIIMEGTEFVAGGAVTFIPLSEQGNELIATVDFPAQAVFTIGSEPQVGVPSADRLEFMLYPNPAESTLNIQLMHYHPDSWECRMYDAPGKLVKVALCAGASAQLDVSELPSGVYLLSFDLGDAGEVRTRIIIR